MLTTLAELTESKSNIVSQTMHQNTAAAGFGTPVTADGDVQLFGHVVAHHSSHLSLSLSLSLSLHPHPYLVSSLMPQSPPFFHFPLEVSSTDQSSRAPAPIGFSLGSLPSRKYECLKPYNKILFFK